MSNDDDDWFEKALREDQFGEADGESEADSSGQPAESGAGEPAGEDPLEEEFAAAFEEETPEEIGGEPYESEMARIDLGINGLDNMIQGGIPEESLMVAIGGAGTGKTTFGLQFILEGLKRGEPAVFIALEETYEGILGTADARGWGFSEYIDDGQLALVDLDPIEMANSIASIRSELPPLIQEFGATRLVLDSVSLLEMMYDEQAIRRNEIFDFTRSLKRAGVTTLFTSESSEQSPYASRYGIIEYLTDAVFILQYIRAEDFRETRMAVEIQKIRNANHSREMKPFEITHNGLSVYRQANIF